MPAIGIGPGSVFRQDVLAARPPAALSLQGFFFFATDINGGTLYQCTGSSWVPITAGMPTIVAGVDISIDTAPGTITINSELPIASGSQLGGIKLGPRLIIDVNGAISVPIATSSSLGVVKVGSRLAIDINGEISVPIASSTVSGVIKVGSGLAISGGGVLSATGGGGGGGDGGAPLVSGELPGPVILADEFGQCIMVPI